jgi:hypothetical protein
MVAVTPAKWAESLVPDARSWRNRLTEPPVPGYLARRLSRLPPAGVHSPADLARALD